LRQSLPGILKTASMICCHGTSRRQAETDVLSRQRLRLFRNDETEKNPEPNLLEAFPIDSI
jgi:hypothetical protein